MPLTVADIVSRLGGECVGDGAIVIDGIAPLDLAGHSQISFLAHPRYRAQLGSSRAGCVIVAPALRDDAAARGTAIVVPDPYLYYARLSRSWAERTGHAPQGVHPSAVIEPGACIAADASVGALSFVGRDAVIGAGTRIAARVTIGERCVIGARCIVHSGAVIGADGFGFAPHDGQWEKIAQLGSVRIGDDVEIGANTCIDRGALGDTVIEDGVKLDNLIQIGHNVRVGAHTAMAGCVGVAGSAKIGSFCTVGGGAIVLGHLELADHVHITAASVVSRSILKPGQYSGMFPIDDNASWEKNAATLRQLHALRERLRALEKKLP
ncbi:MAG: UDP-3-O-(3-hydroxymyristoyl)glucosamine N-acyltransferase [Aquincola sp.]|nr:UDP-3-O-(3-hydroxymyristoyl)glucosamine N-acyltransferase [Aquincola sp.]